MKGFWGKLIRTCLVATLLIPSLATATLAQDVQVPFLFTDDEKLVQTDLDNAFPRSSALPSDPYLNAPMTRLEYMLTLLEASINDGDWIDMVRQRLSEGFALRRKLHPLESSISIKGFARYRANDGRIRVGYTIDNLGQPKKAMRTTCDALLSDLAHAAPQEDISYLYHNTILGVLAQDEYSKYTPVLETLAKSIIYVVSLHSRTEDTRVHYLLNCFSTGKGVPVQYQRVSFKTSIFKTP